MAVLTRLFDVNADVIYIKTCVVLWAFNLLFIDHFNKILIDFLCFLSGKECKRGQHSLLLLTVRSLNWLI